MVAQTQASEDHAARTRAEILQHAHDLFSHYGYWKTNIGDIAECCSMSPGNLYRYFRNKQAIGLAVVADYFRAAEAAMGESLKPSEGAAEARIRRFITTGVAHMKDETARNPKIVELAEFLMNDEQGWALLQTHIAWKRARLIEEMKAGIEVGELARCPVEDTAVTLLMALKVFWMPTTLAAWRDPETILPELDAVLDLIFRGLRR